MKKRPVVISIKLFYLIDVCSYSCPFVRQRTFRHWLLENRYSRNSLVDAGFYFYGQENGIYKIRCFNCDILTAPTTWKSHETPVEAHKRLSKECPFISSFCLNFNTSNVTELADFYVHKDYTEIQKRINSFEDCPYPEMRKEYVNAARTGFFYSEDALTCCCCNIKFFYSDSENDMWQSHVLFSPDCLFLREEKGEEFVKTAQEKWKKIFNPHNNGMKDVESRIATFQNKWKTTVTQAPEMMALAGFYYVGDQAGDSDCVRCFYCNGGLRHWEPADEPWEEHIIQLEDCKFVQLMRGDSYIKHVRKNNKKKTEIEKLKRVSLEKGNTMSLSDMGFSIDDILYATSTFSENSEGSCDYEIEDLLDILIQRHESTKHNNI